MICLTIGVLLDFIIGDPQNPIHPVRIIAMLAKNIEERLRKTMNNNLKLAGAIMWFLVIAITFFVSSVIVIIFNRINNYLGILVSSIMIYCCISSKGLIVEGLKVVKFILNNDIIGARKQLSYIVGRDTSSLEKDGILKAVVETLAENLSDGVAAPLFYIGIGGAPLGIMYKAVNTMDSMFGYKNERYREFGYFSAKADDIFNYIPARLTAILIMLVSFILRLNTKNSFKVYKRDRNKHLSPNSAHPEAAVAGALNLRLGGPNYYFGKLVEKPYIGDHLKDIEVEDVYITNKIIYSVTILAYIIAMIFIFIIRR